METQFKTISLGDKKYFFVDNGERIRKEDINKAQGKIPVYSTSKIENEAMGYVSDDIKKVVPKVKKFNGKFITVNADGSVGKVFLREGEFYLNDVANIIKILDKDILYEYLVYELQSKINILGYGNWSKKLYKTELKQEVSVEIPINKKGDFDLDKQKDIAKRYKLIKKLKKKLIEDYERIKNIKVDIKGKYKTKSIPIPSIFHIDLGNSKYDKKYFSTHKGTYPVYSGQTSNEGEIAKINTFDFDREALTWTIDGFYAGTVFHRTKKFSLTCHCGLLTLRKKWIKLLDYEFLKFVLNLELPNNTFGEANKRLKKNHIQKLSVEIPINKKGDFDLDKQKDIAKKFRNVETIKNKLENEYVRLTNAEVQIKI